MKSWATVVQRRGNQQKSGSGGRGIRGNLSRAGSHWNYRTLQDKVNQSQGSGYETGEGGVRRVMNPSLRTEGKGCKYRGKEGSGAH